MPLALVSRRAIALPLAALALIACGAPEVDNDTSESVVHAFDQSQGFELDLTANGNAIDEVNAVVNFAVHEMAPGAGGVYSTDVLLSDCQLLVPYTFNIEYDSNHPDEPAGLLIENDPPAGAYILRRTGAAPGGCRVYEGLSFNVTSTADLVDVNPGDGVCGSANGPCTLRAAIMEANARPGHDRITLAAGPYVLELDGSEALDAPDDSIGDLDITDGVSILGPSQGGAVIDADHVSRIFQIDATIYEYVNLTLLTLENGLEFDEPGGAIWNASSTKLDRVVMMGNQLNGGNDSCGNATDLEVCNRGGAIFNKHRMLLRSSTVRGNATYSGLESGQGGGISNFGSSARLYLESSTIAENSARFIAGVHNYQGRIEAINTTFADNDFANWASSIYTSGSSAEVFLRHVTFSEGAALPVIVNGGESDIVMEASVVHIGSEEGQLCVGEMTSNRDNFVGGSDPAQDYVGNGCTISGIDPQFGELHVSSLGYHGGPTDTVEINPQAGDLDVIDSDSLVCPNFDQRGESRTGGTDGAGKIGCDPGAVEHDLAGAPAPGRGLTAGQRLASHQEDFADVRARGLVDDIVRSVPVPCRAEVERVLHGDAASAERAAKRGCDVNALQR